MPLRRPTRLAAIVLLALTVLPVPFARAGDPITVQLSSGRSFSGEVDPRTNNETLWLRFGGPAASLLRPIAWQRVESIARGGEPLSKADLLQQTPEPESDARVVQIPGRHGPMTEIRIRNAPAETANSAQASDAPAIERPATHLDFYAALANWDADPYPDGLLLHLTLLDAERRPVAASGSLQAELFAPVARRFQAVPHGRGASVLPLARWSESVPEQQFRGGEAVIRLPFNAVKPSVADLNSPYGLLHVRLAVPGHGVFEDSYDGIRLQRFTPTRDLRERQGLSRTLFTEPAYRERLP